MFTYQALYWGWLKLEAIEKKHENESEIQGLKDQLRSLVGKAQSDS
jgi:hypothetical protein